MREQSTLFELNRWTVRTTDVRPRVRAARLAWLWPLLGIVGEVVFLVVVIGAYEVRRYWLKQREAPETDESRALDQQQHEHQHEHELALRHADADAAHATDIRLRALKA